MPFRWSIAKDTALCVEITKIRPDKMVQWLEIAHNLNRRFSEAAGSKDETSLTGRGCRDRHKLLIKKYKQEDTRSLKRYCWECILWQSCSTYDVCAGLELRKS